MRSSTSGREPATLTRTFAPVLPWPEPFSFEAVPVAQWLDDLKLFATGWIGGLVVFGTFFG